MKMLKASLMIGVATTGLGAVTVPTTALAADDENAPIIVTARRTEERLQDVPISMTVFNQEEIAERNVITSTDLTTVTPSLSMNQQYGPEKASFAIRGFVQDQATAPSVGVYFADVTMPRAQGGTTSAGAAPVGSFVDLENVQVLKGPQGTLFGRNTTGGAILLVPKKPTDNLEGYVEGSLGNYSMKRVEAVLNVPLADTFKVRAMIDRNKRNGFMRNHSGIGPKDYNDLNYFAARLSVVADLTPDLENYMIGTYSNSFGNGYAARIEICQRDPSLRAGIAALTAPSACDQIDRQNARGDKLYDVDINGVDPFIKLRQWSVINTTTWQASDTLTIKNIISYTEFRELASFNLSGDNFFIHGAPIQIPYNVVFLDIRPGYYNSAARSFTEELQLQGKTPDGKFTWQAGGYYEKSSPLGWSSGYTGTFADCPDPSTGTCANNPLGFGSISASRTKLAFINYAVYAQGTYNFTDQLALTAGIRYTWDKINAANESTRIILGSGTTGPVARICNDQLRFKGPGGVGPKFVADPSECHYPFTNKSHKPTWLINLDYKPTPDLLFYAKWARGYRQGGLNLTNIGVESWGPEKVEAYEAGAKASFRGAVSGYFDVSVFYNDFTNQQINASLIAKPTSGLTGGAGIVNAGSSKIYGVEVDAAATFFDSLRIQLGYAYLNATLKSISVPTLPPESPFSAYVPSAQVGQQLALTPKNRVTLSGTYTLPLDESLGKLSVGATLIHTDKQVATLGTLPQFQHLPATDIVNINVNWDNVLSQPFDLSFFVTNLTDKRYPVAVRQFWYSFGYESRLYAPPRMWGFRLKWQFGQ